jgi:hypothetical protein
MPTYVRMRGMMMDFFGDISISGNGIVEELDALSFPEKNIGEKYKIKKMSRRTNPPWRSTFPRRCAIKKKTVCTRIRRIYTTKNY